MPSNYVTTIETIIFITAERNVRIRLQSPGNCFSNSISRTSSIPIPVACCVYALLGINARRKRPPPEFVCNDLEPLCAKEIKAMRPPIHL